MITQYQVPNEAIKVVNIPDIDVNTVRLKSMAESFEKQLQAPECNLNDLEVFTWDIVAAYVEKSKELCTREILAIISGGDRIDALSLFVPTLQG